MPSGAHRRERSGAPHVAAATEIAAVFVYTQAVVGTRSKPHAPTKRRPTPEWLGERRQYPALDLPLANDRARPLA